MASTTSFGYNDYGTDLMLKAMMVPMWSLRSLVWFIWRALMMIIALGNFWQRGQAGSLGARLVDWSSSKHTNVSS